MNTKKQFYCPRYKEEFNYTLICLTCPERPSCIGRALKLISERLNKINKTEEKERERKR